MYCMKWRELFDETIRNGLFALLILQVLTEGDKTKQEIHGEIGIRTDGVFCKANSFFLVLQDLLTRKLIASDVTPIDETHQLTTYRIEDSGRDYLQYGKIHLKNVTLALRLFFGQELTADTEDA